MNKKYVLWGAVESPAAQELGFKFLMLLTKLCDIEQITSNLFQSQSSPL